MIFIIFIGFFLSTTVAHIRLTFPKARSTNSGIKGPYPCGNEGFFVDGHAVTELKPGPQIIEIEETVYHRGAPMRIAISKNSDNDFDKHVLMSHIPHPDNAKTGNPILKMVVDIPNIDCERCSLQILSIMTDKIGNACCSYPTESSNTCFSVYHTCANIKINGTGMDMPTSPSMIDVWAAQEGSDTAWQTDDGGKSFLLKNSFVPFVEERCVCNANECTRKELNVEPEKIFPKQLNSNETTENMKSLAFKTECNNAIVWMVFNAILLMGMN